MQTSTFAIGLFGDRLEVALWRRGSLAASRRRPIALEETTDLAQWSEAVRNLGPILHELVREIAAECDARVRRAFVLYTSPTAVGDCESFPVTSASHARSAAALAVMDSMHCDAETVVTGTLFVERDHIRHRAKSAVKGAAAALTSDDRGPRAHVIAAADCESALQAIQAMVERANLCFRGAVPVQPAVAARAFAAGADQEAALLAADDDRRASDSSSTPATAVPTAHLHIAESGSFLLIRDCGTESGEFGCLRFTRAIPIGTSGLAAALMRRSKVDADDAQEHEEGAVVEGEPSRNPRNAGSLDADAARRALYELGLPPTPDAVHDVTGLTGRDVLPLLQPLVQRMTVELRQSLRFALDAAERSRVTLVITGAGASVPGLAAALGRELSVPAFVQRRMHDEAEPMHECGAMADLRETIDGWISRSADSLAELALQPRELAMRLSASRLRRGLWAGAAAALLLIVLDAARLASHLAHAQREDTSASLTVQPAAIAGHNSFLARVADNPEETLVLIEAAGVFRRIVERETSRQVDFRAAMHELSRITPPTVRFTTVNFQPATNVAQSGNDRIGATIAGVARPSGQSPARSELERFIDRLRSSPLFEDVSLATVHMESEDSLDQRFELRFAAPPAPTHALRNRIEPAPMNEPQPTPAGLPAIAAAPTSPGGDE